MADWGPVIVATVLFVLLTPGLLCTLPGRGRVAEFGSLHTSGLSILVHAVVYFALVTIFLIAIGVHVYSTFLSGPVRRQPRSSRSHAATAEGIARWHPQDPHRRGAPTMAASMRSAAPPWPVRVAAPDLKRLPPRAPSCRGSPRTPSSIYVEAMDELMEAMDDLMPEPAEAFTADGDMDNMMTQRVDEGADGGTDGTDPLQRMPPEQALLVSIMRYTSRRSQGDSTHP
ncbi:hypothetical protein ACQ4PT_045401 [Festuca glaucescens]